MIVMVKTNLNPESPLHKHESNLVPMDSPGVEILGRMFWRHGYCRHVCTLIIVRYLKIIFYWVR